MDDYIRPMCGRVIQSSRAFRYAIVDGMNVRDSRVHNSLLASALLCFPRGSRARSCGLLDRKVLQLRAA
jgi:hypothetical protein